MSKVKFHSTPDGREVEERVRGGKKFYVPTKKLAFRPKYTAPKKPWIKPEDCQGNLVLLRVRDECYKCAHVYNCPNANAAVGRANLAEAQREITEYLKGNIGLGGLSKISREIMGIFRRPFKKKLREPSKTSRFIKKVFTYLSDK